MRMQQCYLRIALRARSASGLLDALGLGYDLPVGQAVYAIDAFPDDDLLTSIWPSGLIRKPRNFWRIEWIGGVGYNTSVPSEPQIDVCLAQLPKGEKNPLSARARSSQVEKRTVKIGVGLLPYVWIGSVGHIPMKADANQMLTGLGTGQGTWGTSNLLLTKLTTVPTPAPKRRDAPVLPANLETFVKGDRLLAEQRSCEVGLIGLGRGDSSFGPHTLASFPTHDPRKGKRIAWAWIKSEKRPRRVAIAEVGLENKFAYALEIERTNQEHSILVLAREDSQRIAADRLQAHSFSKMALYNRDSSGMLGLCT